MNRTIERPFVTIVAGLPRSGTSLTMQMLAAGGMPVLTDGERRPDDDNPRGYYEFEAVKRTKANPSWLESADGKAVKMVYLLLYDLPLDRECRVLLTRRDLDEVLASQRKMLSRNGTPTSDEQDAQMRTLFETQLRQLDKWLSARPNFRVLDVFHHEMIENPLAQAVRIDEFLGGGLDVDAMAAAVDPSLYRNRSGAL